MIVVIMGLMVSLTLILSGCQQNESKIFRAELPPHDETLKMSIQEKTTHGLERIDTTKKTYYDRIQDLIYTYEIDTEPLSYLKVTKRILDNDDYFIFTTLENPSEESVELSLSIPVADTGYYSLQAFDQYRTGPRVSDDIKMDLTTTPLGLLTTYKDKEFHSNLMVGKQYHSREISESYEDNRESVLRELISENQNVDIDVKEDELTLKMDMESIGDDIIDHWLMFSNETLFDSKASYEQWIRLYNGKRYKNNNWYTARGPYKKVVRTAVPIPESELQYGRNLLIVREDEPLSRYKDTQERYFYNLLLNSIANLDIFKGDKDFWETEYTNNWLNRVYGIEAPYIDTRHNEGVALFLEETGNVLDIPELKQAMTNYADFLVDQIEAEQVVKIGPNAGLISDYFTYHQDVSVTHSSLNHVLGGMNLLLETYNDTGEEKYLTAATYVQNGIDELGSQWLTDDGDTWYQINPDYSFQGEDYTLLTLTDLLHSLGLWKGIDKTRTSTLEMLIESKANYLVNEDINLSDEVVELLNEHGFGEIVKE